MVGEDEKREGCEGESDASEARPVSEELDTGCESIAEIAHNPSAANPEEHHFVGLSDIGHVLVLSLFVEPDVLAAAWRLGVVQLIVFALYVLLI